MKIFTKQELIESIKKISLTGWHKSVKTTKEKRNDGAVGNTLERFLGIEENNLPIPNAAEWELKGQRKNSSALITLNIPSLLLVLLNLFLRFYYQNMVGNINKQEKNILIRK